MKISLVVPLFNEEQTIELFYQAVRSDPALKAYTVEIVFIDDGSKDQSNRLAAALAKEDSDVQLITFSRNFGKEAALFAGFEHADGDAVIPMDVDLQDPVCVLSQLITVWKKGADIVLAKRRSRSEDHYLKRSTAALFYKLMGAIASTRIEANVGDFRLIDRRVVDVIKALPEQQLFMKGVLSWAGFNTEVVEYDRAARVAGVSKFNVWKLWNFALDGITSFSTVPLRLWSYVGGTVALLSVVYAIYLALEKVFTENSVPGYPSLMVSMLFLGGVQLIGIGILGEYVGRIYMEIKHRPRYVIKGVINSKSAAQ